MLAVDIKHNNFHTKYFFCGVGSHTVVRKQFSDEIAAAGGVWSPGVSK